MYIGYRLLLTKLSKSNCRKVCGSQNFGLYIPSRSSTKTQNPIKIACKSRRRARERDGLKVSRCYSLYNEASKTLTNILECVTTGIYSVLTGKAEFPSEVDGFYEFGSVETFVFLVLGSGISFCWNIYVKFIQKNQFVY